MRNINLTTAKKLCDEGKLDGVIIFGFQGEAFISTSWGKDRKQCERFGKVLDQIHDKIESEEISV